MKIKIMNLSSYKLAYYQKENFSNKLKRQHGRQMIRFYNSNQARIRQRNFSKKKQDVEQWMSSNQAEWKKLISQHSGWARKSIRASEPVLFTVTSSYRSFSPALFVFSSFFFHICPALSCNLSPLFTCSSRYSYGIFKWEF